ncbi:flavodoxin [Enterovibrio norvegicus FF-33]|uniref:flavodoxin family protein n=1 Tax=Enterovibrio TaxID=188143 RepID=UPI0002E74DA9|nr:flavodoxin family protein [Enterovibrio norvegicus]OEE69680.1 flavodoxin [Enterovibrio norvegicus FF-33]OEE81674.1 flavodoxin [Enterovibrio norvegicus FF-162]
MKNIAIVYFSQTGTTDMMAQAIASGAENKGARILAYRIQGKDIQEGRFRDAELFASLLNMDAIIFGSPTYMGGPAAQFKAFADASSETWSKQGWHNKLAAGFTIGGSPCGEVQSTVEYFNILATQHSMLWVGMDAPDGSTTCNFNRLNASIGAISLSEDNNALHPVDVKTAMRLGERVAELLP